MNNELFDRANERYRLRDYRGALMAFTECLQDTNFPLTPGEMGLLYHQIGNCLVKLKNPREAIQAYSQATADTAYRALATVECNLGMAYASLRDYTNAINCFEKSVADTTNPTPYKSYMGMGNALMKLGKSAEAGVAFREAALDESNPDPTKALLNLGVCFMALNRPADAVASYESALQFDMQPATRNKVQASLGQAYVACGQMEKAVHAFEEAIADKTYYLSDSASVDYQRAVGAVAQGTSEQNQATQVLQLADMSGLDVAADGTYLGAIVIADTVKPDAARAIADLRAAGVKKTVMLTGDIKKVADHVAQELGVDEVHAELLPGDKVARLERLLGEKGKDDCLAFVGDGINDAPVLTRADIGIAMGAMGSDAAIEAADIVLMNDDPDDIARAIHLARRTMGIVWQNIVFALGVKFAVLVLAAFGIANMWMAVFADVGVAVIAILNAMRAMNVKRYLD